MRLVLALFMMIPGFAFAAGGGGGAPTTTQTTKSCSGIKVWDEKAGKCVNPQESHLDMDTLFGAIRELAYAGRYEDAQGVLRAMPDQSHDLTLTYWGFTHRKLGNLDQAHAYYARAIAQNPDNILARSYMGQGYVEEGRTADAVAQWREIRARGGEGTFAETSLRDAIRTGTTYNF